MSCLLFSNISIFYMFNFQVTSCVTSSNGVKRRGLGRSDGVDEPLLVNEMNRIIVKSC